MKRGDTPDASNCTEKSIDPLQEKEAGAIPSRYKTGKLPAPLHKNHKTKMSNNLRPASC